MDIYSYEFPQKKHVSTLAIALQANGASSYRDACNICRLANEKWNSSTLIICDSLLHINNIPGTTQVILVKSKQELLGEIKRFVKSLIGCDLLFSLSAHGYGTRHGHNLKYELNGQSEFVKVNGCPVMDYELAVALYTEMAPDIHSLCLVDTCHSGTMLDLEYISTDGEIFNRSRIPDRIRPFCFSISACGDYEMAGEDISTYGGWGGKLISFFLDYVGEKIHVMKFYKNLRHAFLTQTNQRSHPVISYNRA